MGRNPAPSRPRSQPLLSSIFAFLAAFTFAWPPTGIYALLTGDPQWAHYGPVWIMTIAAPFVALGVVRWFTRKREPLPWVWSWVRAGLLCVLATAAGVWTLHRGQPNVLVTPIVPFAGALGVLLLWIILWKIIDTSRPLRFSGPRVVAVGGRPVMTTVSAPKARPKAKAKPKPKKVSAPSPPVISIVTPRPGDIWWAYVPFADGDGAKHRPCVVVRSFKKHTYVIAITRQQRNDHVWVPPNGWNSDQQRPSYVHLDRLAKVEYHRFDRRMGTCPAVIWAQIVQHHPPDRPINTAPTPPRPAPPPTPKPPPKPAPTKAKPAAAAPPVRKPFDPARSDGVPERLSDPKRASGGGHRRDPR